LQIKEITDFLEQFAPLSLQEKYDNCGLLTGNSLMVVNKVLITLDTTEKVIDEAIEIGANLIISHHPIIFNGLKQINGKNYIERTIIKAIKNDIAIYAIHTNLDNVELGVNQKICEKLDLINTKILENKHDVLSKLVTFVPIESVEKVRNAIFDSGAGHIGNYDCCSFNIDGNGSFRALEKSNPYVGKIGETHFENEIRIETIFPKYNTSKVIKALLNSHPYEEVAYDIYSLENTMDSIGAGMIGELKNEMNDIDFLKFLKNAFNLEILKHSPFINKKIKKVAVCGGSGSFLLYKAKQEKADVFITGDIKYHQFFDAENQIIIIDIGHYESEIFTKNLIYDLLTKKFPKFALHFSNINTNPIKYF
jgi:dinuclear metal center YbgI/SA1388 family protein